MVQNKIDLGTRTKEVPSDPKHGKKVKMGRRLPKNCNLRPKMTVFLHVMTVSTIA
jgi:hypothetical protein